MKYSIYTLLTAAILTIAAGVAMAEESKIPQQPLRPPLALVTPNGGEVVMLGEMVKVTWVAMPKTDHYTLLLTSANGKSWTEIAPSIPASETYFMWKAVQGPAEGCILKIEAHQVEGEVFSDESDKAFRIVAPPVTGGDEKGAPHPGKLIPPQEGIVQPVTPSLRLVSPNGGEMFIKGSPCAIIWTGSPAGVSCDLFISVDAGKSWSAIAEEKRGAHEALDNATAQYVWIVDAPESKQCLIKVVAKDANGLIREDASDKTFRIMIEQMGDKPRKAK